MTPSRRPPLPICSGWPSSSESFSSSSTPVARMRTRWGSSSKRRGRPRPPGRHRGPGSPAPASRTRAPRRPGAAARWRCRRPRPPAPGCSISTPPKMSSMRSRTLRISAAEGGSEAISSSARTPEPTCQERTSWTPAGNRAEDHLGRATADIDDADLPRHGMPERLGGADEGEPAPPPPR